MKPLSRVLSYIAGGLIALFVGGLFVDHYSSWQMPYDGFRQMPYRANVSKVVANEPVATEVRKVQVIKPRPRSQARIEKAFSLDLDKLDLLAVIDVPPSEDGSMVAATIGDDGAVSFTIKDNRPPAFSLGGKWKFGAGAVLDTRLGVGGTVLLEKQLGSILGGRLEGRGSVSIFKSGPVDARFLLVATN